MKQQDTAERPELTTTEQLLLEDIKREVRACPGYSFSEYYACPCGYRATLVSWMIVHARSCERAYLHNVERIFPAAHNFISSNESR